MTAILFEVLAQSLSVFKVRKRVPMLQVHVTTDCKFQLREQCYWLRHGRVCLPEFTCVCLHVSSHNFEEVIILLKILITYAHRWTAEYFYRGYLKLRGNWSSPSKKDFFYYKSVWKENLFSHFSSKYLNFFTTLERTRKILWNVFGKWWEVLNLKLSNYWSLKPYFCNLCCTSK